MLLTGSLFLGCRTDFDVNAEWKDIPIVYGLLDIGEDVHYIKINRAFLGNGNALVMAQVADSVYYSNRLTVYLEEWKSGSFTGRNIHFDTLTLWGKPAGTFASQKQLVYATDTNATTKLRGDCTYKLFIKNPSTGLEVNAQTPIVDSITITRPNSSQTFISFINRISANITWRTVPYGRLYQLIVRFNYAEIDANTVKTKHSIDWNLGTLRSTTITGGEEMSIGYVGNDFFKTIKAKVPVNINVKRVPINVELIISAAGDDLATYIDVNKPSSGIIQEKPEFTNITNGIGIFSSRYTRQKAYNLSIQTIDTLISGMFTKELGFQKPDPTIP